MSGLAEIVRAGVRLSVNGDKLHVRPPQRFAVTPQALSTLRAAKPWLLPLLCLCEQVCGGLDLDPGELATSLPRQDTEALIRESDGIRTLRAYAEAVADRKAIERGTPPRHYTSQTYCRGCGPVPIFPGAPTQVDGCPWCWNRLRGLPMPELFESQRV